MVNPKCYASSNSLQKSIASAIINEFADHLMNVSGKCMDIGCGPGDITKSMILPALNPNATIIGTDILKEMIEYANEMYIDGKRLSFEVLDIQTKRLPKKYVSQFDHIFSFSALMMCKDIRQAFENIYQILRPGGIMLVSFAASLDGFDVFKLMSQNILFQSYFQVQDVFYPYFNSPQARKEIKELLSSIGFQIQHFSQREKTFRDKNTDNFVSAMMSVFKFLDKMPRDLAEDFKTSFKNEYVKRKINFKSINENGEETFVLELLEIFVILAQKPV